MAAENQSNEMKYGGCEGPEAMYVKLISYDGHEFIIKREYALTSGTIKAMLSGPGMKFLTFYVLINSGICIEIKKNLADFFSDTILNLRNFLCLIQPYRTRCGIN